jgi:hypothetical protein
VGALEEDVVVEGALDDVVDVTELVLVVGIAESVPLTEFLVSESVEVAEVVEVVDVVEAVDAVNATDVPVPEATEYTESLQLAPHFTAASPAHAMLQSDSGMSVLSELPQ